MIELSRTTELTQPREAVAAWHERSGAFTRLTPPGMALILRGPSNGIHSGSLVTLRVTTPELTAFGPMFPVRGAEAAPLGLTMTLRHEQPRPGFGFVDEQVRGPFASYRHEHRFEDAPGGSRVVDVLRAELPFALRPFERRIRELLQATLDYRSAQLRGDLDQLEAGVPERVLVTGASGMIGTQLRAFLSAGGSEVRRAVRREPRNANEVRWDPAAGIIDSAALDVDAVVNLSGRSIGGRFTDAAINDMRTSRLDSTHTLVKALQHADARCGTYVQASAIGAYGPRRPGVVLREDDAFGDGILADLVRDWEDAATPLAQTQVRATFLRTGLVLAAHNGALAPQLPLYEVGAGGPITAPERMASWIALDDLVHAYAQALVTPTLAGPVNAVAPHPTSWGTFATTLGEVLHRPSKLPTPGFGPKLVLGKRGAEELIETDQRVSAERLESSGFAFAWPSLRAALEHTLVLPTAPLQSR